MTELKVYSIPEMNYSELETKLSKLNKKAIKLNCEPIVLTLLGTVDLKISVPWQNNQILVRHNQVTISGVAPIIAGWELIASCEGFENGTLIRSIPEKEFEVEDGYVIIVNDLSQESSEQILKLKGVQEYEPYTCSYCGKEIDTNELQRYPSEDAKTKECYCVECYMRNSVE